MHLREKTMIRKFLVSDVYIQSNFSRVNILHRGNTLYNTALFVLFNVNGLYIKNYHKHAHIYSRTIKQIFLRFNI